jgi:hypothetical protein
MHVANSSSSEMQEQIIGSVQSQVQSQVFKHKTRRSGTNGIQLLVAYAELRKATISFFMNIGPSVRPN